jgi:hypothetical protein
MSYLVIDYKSKHNFSYCGNKDNTWTNFHRSIDNNLNKLVNFNQNRDNDYVILYDFSINNGTIEPNNNQTTETNNNQTTETNNNQTTETNNNQTTETNNNQTTETESSNNQIDEYLDNQIDKSNNNQIDEYQEMLLNKVDFDSNNIGYEINNHLHKISKYDSEYLMMSYYKKLKPTIEKYVAKSTETMYKQLFAIINDIASIDKLIDTGYFESKFGLGFCSLKKYMYYKPENKLVDLTDIIVIFQNHEKIKILLDKLILHKFKFNTKYLCNKIDFSNEILKYILNNIDEKDRNILYLSCDDSVKFEKMITELNMDPNNEYNLIGVLTQVPSYINGTQLIINGSHMLYYNIALKHGFKFPNLLSFLCAYTLFKEDEQANIEYLNDSVYGYLKKNSEHKENILYYLDCYTETDLDKIIEEYTKNNNKINNYLRCEDTYDLTSSILKDDYNKFKTQTEYNQIKYDNPYTSYDFEQVQKYINVKEPVIFNKEIFNKQYDELIELYSKNNIVDFSLESRKELYKYLKEMYEQHYDVMKTFIKFK